MHVNQEYKKLDNYVRGAITECQLTITKSLSRGTPGSRHNDTKDLQY